MSAWLLKPQLTHPWVLFSCFKKMALDRQAGRDLTVFRNPIWAVRNRFIYRIQVSCQPPPSDSLWIKQKFQAYGLPVQQQQLVENGPKGSYRSLSLKTESCGFCWKQTYHDKLVRILMSFWLASGSLSKEVNFQKESRTF